MNMYLLIAGVLASLTVIGHFAVGQKSFLRPMVTAEFDEVAKQVMHSVFHYVSVFLLLSALVLLAAGLGYLNTQVSSALAVFIALNYTLFALWQVIIALKSGLERPLAKLFQWVFFVLIAFFAIVGS